MENRILRCLDQTPYTEEYGIIILFYFLINRNMELSTVIILEYLSSIGSVPVVVGAPNIQDFAPSSGSLLHIKEIGDAESVAKTMKYLAGNPDAYNATLR